MLNREEKNAIGLLRHALCTLRDAGLVVDAVPVDGIVTVWRREPGAVRLLDRIETGDLLLDRLPTED